MLKKILLLGVIASLSFTGCGVIKNQDTAAEKLKVVILDGQNNHAVWPKSTLMMKQYLEQSGLFEVDIYRTSNLWRSTGHNNIIEQYPLNDGKIYQEYKEPKADVNFTPNFEAYDVVVSNLGWKTAPWPAETKAAFEAYMKRGGGLVVVHAADNAFPEWKAYNEMIGLGGWGNRNKQHGPYVYYNQAGKLTRDFQAGSAGRHGKVQKFHIDIRDSSHPITQGLPERWLHAPDEMYEHLRGPAQNMTILATAYPHYRKKGDARNEPVLMTLNYHKGRIFHTTLGHDQRAFEGVGFITTFLRGAEWVATGKVSLPVPTDFPTESNANIRKFNLPK
ncbi:ThuA domain-containing protein [Colwellia sp. RE-S-Sl-9]